MRSDSALWRPLRIPLNSITIRYVWIFWSGRRRREDAPQRGDALVHRPCFGAGMHRNTVTASVRAIVSAANRIRVRRGDTAAATEAADCAA